VLRGGGTWLWSRGEELITERFPEVVEAARPLADAADAGGGIVLDGEILAWDAGSGRPLAFAALQRRIGRRTLSAAVLRDAPAAFVAYDLLELRGEDWRARPQSERRAALEALLSRRGPGGPAAGAGPGSAGAGGSRLVLSPLLAAADWDSLARLREESRDRGVEGLMLKRRDARYGVGRTRADGGADWWKWKIDPYTVDAVLVYAQRGHGRRASLYTDYTFAVWDDSPPAAGDDGTVPARVLVPFAKAYSGLTDEEIRQVDAIVRRSTREKFGPVRSVEPTLVFELGFEGIAASPRHKSGIAVRFPRILRWRLDKAAADADTLSTLRAMLAPPPPA
jgi:DNA ligase 1